MPANLPPQYYEAEKLFRAARTPSEKIEALENMLAIMPKHKGTDHLRGELRAKIAKLSTEQERHQGGTRAALFNVKKDGAGQIALAGVANAGKSQLIASVTDADPKVADYPFTTQAPFPAMMPFENIKIQLVDLPAVTEHETHPWMRSILRAADALFIVLDLSFDPLSEFDQVTSNLAASRIEPIWEGERGMTQEMVVRQRALIVASKLDMPDSPDNLELLKAEVADRLPIVPVSALGGDGLEELHRMAFQEMDVVRVYTKAPGQEPEFASPFVFPRGSTIDDAAEQVHKDLREKLKYAVIWGSGKFSGQRVGRTYVVQDGDVVEFIAARHA